MNSVNQPISTVNRSSATSNRGVVRTVGTRHPVHRRRRPSPPPKDLKDLSSFEKIVGVCVAPAAKAFEYLDETAIYSHNFIEEQDRDTLYLLALVETVLGLCVGSVIWCLLKGIALALRKVQRPKYYPQEQMRRQALARERRRIRRRTTINNAPTADELLAQWAKVKKNPVEMIRFGSMLCDLEAYVDNSLLRNENGEIVGRNPGIRGWLNVNCQQLAVRYKTVMGYKAMAEKFRQAIGLSDPYPAALALEEFKNTVQKSKGEEAVAGGDKAVENHQNTVRKDDGEEVGSTDGRTSAGEIETKLGRGIACKRARRRAGEMLAECRWSQRSVMLALTMRLAPDRVPPEIELEERRRQGLPPKDGLARCFVQMMA